MNRLLFRLLEATGVFASSFLFLVAMVINGLANQANELFQTDTGNVSNVYFTQATPAGWAFSIWGFIYTWQALWLVYSWTFVIREFFVPNTPRPISLVTYLLYCVSWFVNISWIILWGNWLVVVCLPFLILIVLFLYAALAFTLWRTYKVTSKLSKTKWGKVDLWLTRILVHNGIAFYSTWVSIAWLINVAIVAQYFGGMAAVDAGTLLLSLLLVEVVVWCVLEHTILYRFARYIQSVYIVPIVALSAVVADHWNRTNEEDRNHHFALGLLVLVVVVQIVKIVLTIVFAFVRPVKFPECKSKEEPLEKKSPVVGYKAV